MDDKERAFLDWIRGWYGSGEGRDIDTLFSFCGHIAPPLCYPARRGWRSAMRWLLDHGANVEATGEGDATSLHFAVLSASDDLIDPVAAVLLLDAGARVDARDSTQRTPLHIAAQSGRLRAGFETCKLLLSRGASLDARDWNGRDPEAIARAFSNPIMADFLAGVRAAGGWAAYVAAPRNQLLVLRRELPTLFRTGPCSAPRAQARLFLDKKIPDDVFMHVLTFWRSERDLEPI